LSRFRVCIQHLAIIAVVFAISLAIRTHYQSRSETASAVRADAAKYTLTAYNIKKHGAFSLEQPAETPPQTRTDLRPGYPTFLTIWIDTPNNLREFADQVARAQSVLGSLIVVVTFLIARCSFPWAFSLLPALLVAICPHLIALEQYVLTETLFTFLLMTGLLVLVCSWQRQSISLVIVAGLILGLSASVRYITYFLPLACLPLMLFSPEQAKFASRRQGLTMAAALFLGWSLALTAEGVFERQYVHNADGVTVDNKHADLSRTTHMIRSRFSPPNWYARGETTHVLADMEDQTDKNWKLSTKQPFSEIPGKYITWNLWGRWVTLWNFDQLYHGGTTIYRMKKDGFKDSAFLALLYRTMRWLHWPLFILSVTGSALVLTSWCRHRLTGNPRLLLVSLFALAYLAAVLLLVSYIPRYSIPLRPLSYIMIVPALHWTAGRIRARLSA